MARPDPNLPTTTTTTTTKTGSRSRAAKFRTVSESPPRPPSAMSAHVLASLPFRSHKRITPTPTRPGALAGLIRTAPKQETVGCTTTPPAPIHHSLSHTSPDLAHPPSRERHNPASATIPCQQGKTVHPAHHTTQAFLPAGGSRGNQARDYRWTRGSRWTGLLPARLLPCPPPHMLPPHSPVHTAFTVASIYPLTFRHGRRGD